MIKKIKSIFLVIITLLIFLVIYKSVENLSGLPWDKRKAYIEIENHLQKEFKINMVIKEIKYNVKTKNYFAIVNSSGEDNFEFKYYLNGENTYHNYYSSFWSNEAEKIFLEKLYAINITDIEVQVVIFAPNLFDKYGYLYDAIPKYSKVKNELSRNMDLTITFLHDFEQLSNTSDDYTELFYILNIAKESTPFETINFKYNNVFYQLNNNDVEYIKKPADISRYLKDVTQNDGGRST